MEAGAPAVVAQRRHGNLVPAFHAGLTIPQQTAQLVVAVGEDVRFDDDRFAHRAFDRKAAAIDLRADPLDHDAGAAC